MAHPFFRFAGYFFNNQRRLKLQFVNRRKCNTYDKIDFDRIITQMLFSSSEIKGLFTY